MRTRAIILLAVFAIGLLAVDSFAQARQSPAKKSSSRQAQSKSRAASDSASATKQISSRAARTPRNPDDPFDVFMSRIDKPPFPNFAACMDNYCLSADFEEKGRCRCSDTLPIVESLLRQIENTMRDADLLGRQLEVLSHVDNTVMIDQAMEGIHKSIAALERRARTAQGRNVDPRSGVPEGEALMIFSGLTCSPLINELPEHEQTQISEAYGELMERDCDLYTEELKDRLESARSRLKQAEDNMMLRADIEAMKNNVLGFTACREEFEGCVANECGHQFKNCRGQHLVDNVLGRCEAQNAGKCDDAKAIILFDLRDFIAFELKREDLRAACNAAGNGGRIVGGRCIHTVCVAPTVERTVKKCGKWDIWCKTKKAASFALDGLTSIVGNVVVSTIMAPIDVVVGIATGDLKRAVPVIGMTKGIAEDLGEDWKRNITGTEHTFTNCDNDVPLAAPGFASDGFPSDEKFKGAFI